MTDKAVKKPKLSRAIVGVQFPQSMIDALRDYAKADDRPVGYLIRAAVAMYLARRRAHEQAEAETEIVKLMPAVPLPKPEPPIAKPPASADVIASATTAPPADTSVHLLKIPKDKP